MLRINDNYRIEFDGGLNCVLIHSEAKIAEKGKNIGEEYLSETNYYYPNVHTALKRFLELSMEDATDVKDCVKLVEETFEKIKNLKFK